MYTQSTVDEHNGSLPSDSVLGNITNILGTVIKHLDWTESKLESMERKLNTPSSSAGSGAERKRSVPPVVRVCTCSCIGNF